jgi:polyphenol oxidase
VSATELSAALPGNGRVLFTTRASGNLSLAAGDGHELGRLRREALATRLGLRGLCASPQVHGSNVLRISELEGALAEPLGEAADGHATALRGVGVMVLSADCLPVALGADDAVAMVHAGWRGLAGGVLEQGVAALRELGAEGSIAAVIGPRAGACCYEVGAEVHDALGGRHREGRKIDLAAIARDLLLAEGVSEVSELGGCTICQERFYSHRREGERAGRQAGLAWLS